MDRLLGQIATWVTVLVVFLTLREMEKQRKASQKPELTIPNANIFGYRDVNRFLYIALYFTNKEVEDRTGRFEPPNVTIYNIGAGAAKEINLSWNFDIQNTVEFIQDFCYRNSIPVVIRIQDNSLAIQIGSEGGLDVFNLDSSFEYTYLMPASITSQGLNSEIPYYFLQLISFLIFIALEKDGGKLKLELGDVKIPSLSCELGYTDIGGIRYTKKFDVSFHLISLTYFAEENGLPFPKPIFQGILEFREIKDKRAHL